MPREILSKMHYLPVRWKVLMQEKCQDIREASFKKTGSRPARQRK